MGISARQVKNKRTKDGVSTNRGGTVYDVYLRYKAGGEYKTYGKRGFATKQEALNHEAEMRAKLTKPNYQPTCGRESRQTMSEYLAAWVEQHGKANLRPSTFDNYKKYIRNHIDPNIGDIKLQELTPAHLDDLFQKMFDKGLSQSSARYCQRILSVSLEAARKYRYIESNPARDIITKFGKQGKTPDPYTIPQMRLLMSHVTGTEWEMTVMLGGLYGMRMSEIIGLRWTSVDIKKGRFSVYEQMPHKVAAGTKEISEMMPVKSEGKGLVKFRATAQAAGIAAYTVSRPAAYGSDKYAPVDGRFLYRGEDSRS